jgi:hypothetical protein
MERLLIIGGLFVLAGLCEIGGGYLVWGWMRDHKPLTWALLGALILAAYGVVAALQPILTDQGELHRAACAAHRNFCRTGSSTHSKICLTRASVECSRCYAML